MRRGGRVNRPLDSERRPGRNGCVQTLTTTGWIARTGSQIDRIRINEVSCRVVDGRNVWVKRRTPMSRWLVPIANGFFWLAGNPVEVFTTGAAWQDHELETFRLLNGSERNVGTLEANSVYAEALPGSDLVGLLEKSELSSSVMSRVGEAFRKMHRTWNPITGEWFSHGDPHLGNVLFDAENDDIKWVDFETIHHPRLTVTERHADDLLVLLLDLVGRTDASLWDELSPAFLSGYADLAVLAELKKRLRPAIGFGALWWAVRTSYLTRPELRRRIGWLRDRL